MSQVFVFVAGNRDARSHLDDSIRNPIDPDKLYDGASEDVRAKLDQVREQVGEFYAWGAVPGRQNTGRWGQMRPGDFALCVFENTYQYVARVVDVLDSEELASRIWGRLEPTGNTWQLMYFLTKPEKVSVPVPDLAEHLNARYMGFTRIGDSRLEQIREAFGSVESFIESRVLGEIEAVVDERQGPASNAWWVCQGKTYKVERDGSYVWAPKTTRAGTPVTHHTDVGRTRVGDVVVHYAGGQILALGEVMAPPEPATRPEELPSDEWGKEGWLGHVEYFELSNPIKLTEVSEKRRLAESTGPFQKDGAVKQGYLFPLTPSFSDFLRNEFSTRWPPDSPWGGVRVTESPLRALSNAFALALRDCDLSFGPRHDDFVRAFVVSLATKRFAILTGLSGSGKTQIALQFGDFLGPDSLHIEPVRPDWTGPEPLLGYEDALQPRDSSGRTAWAVPSALSFMLDASRNPNKPYLLLLDEMNLAHVERYFADILSGMESNRPCLPNLVRSEHDGAWRVAEGGPGRVAVPDNLFIVGTVNVDETTYMFSPKVLDRANTFEFRVETSDLDESLGKPGRCEAGDPHLVASFLDLAADPSSHDSGTHLTKFNESLRDIHRILSESGFEFGHRTFFEANRFAALLHAAGESGWEQALDLQVLQKVLPRLHGSRRRLESTLCALAQYCYNFTYEPGIVEKNEAVAFDPLGVELTSAQLPRSFDKLRRMTRSLRANQFTSFTE